MLDIDSILEHEEKSPSIRKKYSGSPEREPELLSPDMELRYKKHNTDSCSTARAFSFREVSEQNMAIVPEIFKLCFGVMQTIKLMMPNKTTSSVNGMKKRDRDLVQMKKARKLVHE